MRRLLEWMNNSPSPVMSTVTRLRFLLTYRWRIPIVRQSIFIDRTCGHFAAIHGTPTYLQDRTRRYLHASRCCCIDRPRYDSRFAIDYLVEAVGTAAGTRTGRRHGRNHCLSDPRSCRCPSFCGSQLNSSHVACGGRRDRFHALRCIDTRCSISSTHTRQRVTMTCTGGRLAAFYSMDSQSSVPRDVRRYPTEDNQRQRAPLTAMSP